MLVHGTYEVVRSPTIQGGRATFSCPDCGDEVTLRLRKVTDNNGAKFLRATCRGRDILFTDRNGSYLR